MLVVNAYAALTDHRFLLFPLVSPLKFLSKLFLFLLFRCIKSEEISPLLLIFFIAAHASLFQLCNIFCIHVQVLNSKLQNPIEAGVDISFVTLRVEQVFQEVVTCDLLVAQRRPVDWS